MGDLYQQLVAEFDEQTGLADVDQGRPEEAMDRYEVLDEEVLELEDEIVDYLDWYNGYLGSGLKDRETRVIQEARIAEELADVLVTAFSMADVLGIDITSAFARKMQYNLQKTGGTIEDGKVIDDVEVAKPDFVDCVPFNEDAFDEDDELPEGDIWE